MNRPLRIAFFLGNFPVVSETFVLRQITGLLDLGHAVDIYADTRGEAGEPVHAEIAHYRLLDRTLWMDAPLETTPFELPVWPITGRTWPPGSVTPIWNWVRLVRALPHLLKCLAASPRLTVQVLKKSEYAYRAASFSGVYRLSRLVSRPAAYDALHAHFGPVGNNFRFARQLWHAPLVASFHGYDFSTLPRKNGSGMYARLFDTADLITVNSNYSRAQVERLGCPPQKIRKLPVGLNPEEFPFRERTCEAGDGLRILSVGRLVEIKGHEYILRAVAKLRVAQLAVQCDIVGDGPLRAKLEKLIAELGLQQSVRLHGALNGAGVKRLMLAAHLFVLASVSVEGDQEGQGLVLQEAQACGLPVIATRHGAFPEGVLDGRSGFLVPERDVDALATRVQDLRKHPETWAALGRAGREFVERHYDVRQLNTELVELYREVIATYQDRNRSLNGP